MISSALQLLYDEHEAIVTAIDNARSIIASHISHENEAALRKLLLFFRNYADAYHHQKEEEFLFPALSRSSFALESLSAEFSEHHERFREALTDTERALNAKDWLLAQNALTSYLNDLVDHIAAENEELFVAAEDILTEVDKDRLYYQFLDIDHQLGEENKHALEEEVHHA